MIANEQMKTIEILGFKAKVARTFWERTRGLIGTKSLAPDEGLLIEKCNAIHMCFMSFPIDAYFLDRDDKVVKVVRDIPPWKLFVWGGWRAAKVLETAARNEGIDEEAAQIAKLSGDLVERIREAECQGKPIEELVRRHIELSKRFLALLTLKAELEDWDPLDKASRKIQVIGNMMTWAKKIGAPVDDYERRIFDLRCQFFSPNAVKEIFKDGGWKPLLIILGRSRHSNIRLDEQDVSGRHAEIIREGDRFLAVCLSRQGMVVNDKPVEPSGRRQLREGDCMRIGMKTEVRIVRLPKDGDDVMVLNVTDSHGTREEEVRLPMVAEGAPRGEECLPRFGLENPGPREGDGAAFVCCDDGDSASGGGGMMCTKPVIYLYPQLPIRCSVRVRFDGALTCTYPTHGADGWRDFVAAPDGTLTFPDGRKFYCLYWEGTTLTRGDFSKGYCVRGSETGEFLADILAKMGLSFREANEFIIYWLPRMQDNPYNVIAFQNEIYTQSAKLEIEPKPDSILRVFMAWKASDCPVDIPAPEIKSFGRKGFTVVEWGGTEVGK